MKILVVEDKAVLAQDIVDRLQSFGFNNIIGPFNNGELALQNSRKVKPDLAILDIELKGRMNGIELAKYLKADYKIPIVFLSKHQDDETFRHMLEVNPSYFLNKPFTNSELKMAILNSSNGVHPEPKKVDIEILNDRIFVRNGRGKFFILLNEILWLQSGGGETSKVVAKNSHGKIIEATIGHTLNTLEKKLNFYPYLVRCSRYYIVNLKSVDKIIDGSLNSNAKKKALLVNGQEIPVGSKYRKSVMDKLHIF